MIASASAIAGTSRAPALIVMLLLAFALGGCMHKKFEVRSGNDPSYMDDDVRFRTTYYFRAYDYCESKAGDNAGNRILTDSLYRFRMTGKASSLTNKVRFESGTLDAAAIDPFGADVEFDAQSHRFRFKPRARAEEEATRKQVVEDVGMLLDLQASLATRSAGQAHAKKIDTLIGQRLDRLGYTNGSSSNGPSKQLAVDHDDAVPTSTAGNPNLQDANAVRVAAALPSTVTPNPPATTKEVPPQCLTGQLRRGYQIFGPEGWRTFDQDERLLLAMSSSGKPLIDTLRELSDRVLGTQGSGQVPAEGLLREQVRTLKARQALDDSSADLDDDERLLRALRAFQK